MEFNLITKVINFLEDKPDQKFTANEIAKGIFEAHPDDCEEKRKQSKATVKSLDNDEAVIEQIAREIGARRPRLQKKNLEIKTTEGRPRQYYYTKLTDTDAVKQAENKSGSKASKSVTKEHDLYHILIQFLWLELDIYSKRINEKKSSNSYGIKGNKWLHPDLVALEDLSKDWNQKVKDCVQQCSDKRAKLWSFEVKTLINRSNIREAFFQTVSNSSWANFGYLVAKEIEGTDTLKELRILSSLHGIGFICLDANNASASQIMIPAKERGYIDWNIANRLAKENRDFLSSINSVRRFYQTGDIQSSDWDTGKIMEEK